MFELVKFFLGAVLLFLGVFLATMDQRTLFQQVRELAINDVDEAAKLVLVQKLDKQLVSCSEYSEGQLSHQLARATVLVENQLTNPAERIAEQILGRWMPELIVWLDLSVGPAQIKPSSFRGAELPTLEVMRRTLLPCEAMTTLVQRISDITDGDLSLLPRHRFLNAHTGIHDFKLMNVIYNRLVDSVFLQIRMADA